MRTVRTLLAEAFLISTSGGDDSDGAGVCGVPPLFPLTNWGALDMFSECEEALAVVRDDPRY